ncbi:MAG: tocopherol cyclase family protein [Niameybacter sp.]|uniref:tocopherol cyclase family protein n=1 Tax=Niameybacter sp. TaxID=2033640 RepID=UPI002FC6EB7E
MSRAFYFEGWYFKCSTEEDTIVIIVGRARERVEEAFIQIIRSGDNRSYYIPYSLDCFKYTQEPFTLQIGKSIFKEEYMQLDIESPSITLKGALYFDTFTKLPQQFLQKGLMGPFGYLPFMECYHDVLSMGHTLWGQLRLNSTPMNFAGGKGYVESDWGNSFPKSYLWMQCNHFKQGSLSVMLAVADIPFLGCNFRGFLCVISIENQTRIFATYTGAQIEEIKIEDQSAVVQIKQGQEIIRIKTKYDKGHMLKAPNKGAMRETVYETLEGTMKIQIYHHEVLKVDQVGDRVAFECVGKVEETTHKMGYAKHINR